MKLKYISIAICLILLCSCREEEPAPNFSLEEYKFLTHNSVLIHFYNNNTNNESAVRIQLSGNIENSDKTIHYFQARFLPEESRYSVMLFDLIPSTEYSIKFLYGNNAGSGSYDFKTETPEYFTDPRDNKKYPIGSMGIQVWMLENLDYQTANSERLADSLMLGSYYTWDEAVTACPDGWRLPSDQDWLELEKFIGIDAKYLMDTSQLRGENEMAQLLVPTSFSEYGSTDNTVVNELGFSLKPGGYIDANRTDDIVYGLSLYAYLWTSTEFHQTSAFYRGSVPQSGPNNSGPQIKAARVYMNKENKTCVRCIKD